ncbi:MAG: MMPL family transporter [Deferribacteraceae bacterium]|jgi:predicted exporter|nr:MMPL family transporter [Deferribacteraceae bacterium]
MQKILAVLNKKQIRISLYLALAAALCLLFFSSPIVVKTDILALLPPSEENSVRQEAFIHLSSATMNRMTILIGAEDAEKSKYAGLYFQSKLADSGLNISYETDDTEKVLIEQFSKHTYQLLSEPYKELLAKDHNAVYQKALAMLYTPMSVNIAGFENDPFMLLSDYMLNNSFLRTPFSMVNAVPIIKHEGKIYSLMTADIDSSVLFSPSRLAELMQRVYAAAEDTRREFGVEIVLSGVPLHTHAASSSSMKEINIISIISFVVIFLISLIVLRSPMGFIVSAATIALSFAAAFAVVHIVFSEIHIFALVFGTSLIGLCIDYCLHYFVERGCEVDSNIALVKIIKAISLSLGTSLLGFATLMTSAMPLMKQMALFSVVGLIWAYLTIIVFYPLVFKRLSFSEPPLCLMEIEKILLRLYRYIFAKPVILCVLVLIVGLGIAKLHANDSIEHLYSPSAELLAAETRAIQIHKMAFSPAFFFVSGNSSEEILQTEETLVESLQAEVSAGVLQGYKAISTLIPSEKTQKLNYQQAAGFFSEYIDDFAELTGIDTVVMRSNMEAQEANYLHVADIIDLNDTLQNFWQEGKGSFVLLEGLSDRQLLQKYQGDNIYYLDKIGDYSSLLKTYRHKASIIIAVAFGIIMSIMLFRYKLRLGLLTLLPAISAVAFILAVFGYAGVAVSFFHVIGLFLVLCFGVDYTIFQVETKGKLKYSGVAVLLSCITTLASFGLMAFTSFEVTHSLGLTMFAGILLSYIFSFIPKALIDRG